MIRKLAFCLLLSINIYGSDFQDSKNSALSLGSTVKNKLGSKSGISTHISSPMQSSTQLKTIDNSESFDTRINSCANNDDGIKIKFNPLSNGALNITYSHDKDASGSYDYTRNIYNITHVCGGGFKTGSNFYKWSFSSSSLTLEVQPTSRSQLGECYCITNSCNYGGYSRDIADNIAGDIVASIGSSNIANYEAGINKYDSSNKTYYIYVNDNRTCRDSNYGNDYTGTNPKNYYNSQTTDPLPLADVIARDSSDSQSLYYATKNQNTVNISTTSGNSNIEYDNYKNCKITRSPYYDTNNDIKISIQNSCTNYENDPTCNIDRESVCDYNGKNCVDTVLNASSTTYSLPIHCMQFTDSLQVCDDGNKIYTLDTVGNTNDIYFSSKSYLYSTRVYNCGTESSSFDANKTNNVYNSVSKSGNSLNYNSFDGTSSSVNLGNYNSCMIQYCSYKTNGNNTVSYNDNTSNVDTHDGTSTNDIQYKECTKNSLGNFICPLNSGETLIESCSCNIGNNGISTTLGYVSAIEDAVNDFTCSTN